MKRLRKRGRGITWIGFEDKLVEKQNWRLPFRKLGHKRADHLAGRMLMRALNKPLNVVSTPLAHQSPDWIGVLDSESVRVRPTEDGFLWEWRSD